MNVSRVLVTGAAGGIGWTVTRRLLERQIAVVAADDYTTGMPRESVPGVEWLTGDIADPAFVDQLDACGANAVVHCAARLADRSMQEPTADVRTNCLGSMQIFEWSARRGARLVFLSSSAVYGNPPEAPIREDAPLSPGTVYAVGKTACEGFLRILGHGYGLPWTVLRLFPTYGGAHKPSKTQGIVNVMLTQLMAGDDVVVKGSLERVRDLVYVEDTARAVVDSLLSEATLGRVMNVGCGRGYTIRELIHALAEALGKSPGQLRIREEAGTPGDPRYNVADIGAIRAAIGFEPRFDLRAGTAELVASRRTPAQA